ncbi:interleukin-17B-like [Ruditapes philippinarum]|uniref:interleukin-17B-like n=1 Tax=Ruditapes philippinarum TaxID=129788 RepID=UPI00295A896A|nr:interleukin-17B-like [Ruditapes philippinarum]
MRFGFAVLFTCVFIHVSYADRTLRVKCDAKENITLTERINELHESFYMLPFFRNSNNFITNGSDFHQNVHAKTVQLAKRKSDLLCKTQKGKKRGNKLRRASTCPWHYVLNVDNQRIPTILFEARCNCAHRCLGGMANSRCEPINYYYHVYRKVEEDKYGFCTYRETLEAISVGCTCIHHPKDRPVTSL